MERIIKKEASMKDFDMSKPIIEVLGTEDDPCFGHHLVPVITYQKPSL